MSNDAYVKYGDDAEKTAVLLLEAAEKAGADASVVRTTSDGEFIVPEEIADAAGVEYEVDDSDDDGDGDEDEAPKPTKKAAAKKSAAKKGS